MNIPPNIADLIERLNLELEQTEREVNKGINLVRLPLSRFPENTLLVQFFAYKKFVMKELPDEQTLLELLKLAKNAEQKARELNEMGEQFSQKWLPRLNSRKTIKPQ
jgi:hypothetical protein